ncbi:DUF3311 domain-containing protein [Angustibacter sp. McL0619]|uniref:DUF3311 domain-containing protein n=1 Tax=Angustibacter sp. McL0619 TaxID=3415676 RepID=UPI003CF2B22C
MGTPAEEDSNVNGPAHRNLPTPMIVVVGVLLALPVVALLWVSSYAKDTPRLWGFPFFYWYQLLWVFLAAICTSLAYRIVMGHTRRDGGQK